MTTHKSGGMGRGLKELVLDSLVSAVVPLKLPEIVERLSEWQGQYKNRASFYMAMRQVVEALVDEGRLIRLENPSRHPGLYYALPEWANWEKETAEYEKHLKSLPEPASIDGHYWRGNGQWSYFRSRQEWEDALRKAGVPVE